MESGGYASLISCFNICAVHQTQLHAINFAKANFESSINDIKLKLDARLKANALLLRSSAALFAASDTITQEGWRKFIDREKLNINLPGTQGVGYSSIIPKNQLKQHIQSIRKRGFPDYNVKPVGDREIYTSIIYLEPFSDRNLRAFGFDMFSEPIRRKAMEVSRDSDYAFISDKVILVQETNEDVQAGILMYVPVYRNGMQTNIVEERRAAITGWVYSPYRMNDLMNEILGNRDLLTENRIRLEVFDDDDISDEGLLYDSQGKNNVTNINKSNLYLKLPFVFNGNKWTLQFSGNNENLTIFHGEIFFVLICGTSMSLMLFALSLTLINSTFRTRQIIQLNKQLDRLNSDKDRFISILGHDLKGPFNNILGFSELLSEDIHNLNTNEIEDIAKNINKAAKRTYKLLEDILIWARIQKGNVLFKPQTLSFSDICMNVVDILTQIANAKNITISCYTADKLDVWADKEMLKTILRNLVSNSIKFSNSGDVISLVAVQADSTITISVSDNGIGIPCESLAKLFDISQVLTTKGTAGETGTGLGLLLCKEFVEKHGGRIWAESVAGKGSVFSFSLPFSGKQAT